MKLIFLDGSVLDAARVRQHKAGYNGDTRDALTMQFLRDGRSIDALYALFDQENCEKLTVAADDETNIYSDYVIRDLFRLDSDDTITVRVIQRSQIEKQLQKLIGGA